MKNKLLLFCLIPLAVMAQGKREQSQIEHTFHASFMGTGVNFPFFNHRSSYAGGASKYSIEGSIFAGYDNTSVKDYSYDLYNYQIKPKIVPISVLMYQQRRGKHEIGLGWSYLKFSISTIGEAYKLWGYKVIDSNILINYKEQYNLHSINFSYARSLFSTHKWQYWVVGGLQYWGTVGPNSNKQNANIVEATKNQVTTTYVDLYGPKNRMNFDNWIMAGVQGSLGLRVECKVAQHFNITGGGHLLWQPSLQKRFYPLGGLNFGVKYFIKRLPFTSDGNTKAKSRIQSKKRLKLRIGLHSGAILLPMRPIEDVQINRKTAIGPLYGMHIDALIGEYFVRIAKYYNEMELNASLNGLSAAHYGFDAIKVSQNNKAININAGKNFNISRKTKLGLYTGYKRIKHEYFSEYFLNSKEIYLSNISGRGGHLYENYLTQGLRLNIPLAGDVISLESDLSFNTMIGNSQKTYDIGTYPIIKPSKSHIISTLGINIKLR